ncbi:MAG: hypothetical protein AB3N33_08485 [Puniceicoccaceae bacterium]
MKLSNRNLPLLVLAILLPSALLAEVRFGPYAALTINSDVIRGVKVEENGEVWILLNPAYRERELRVKISNEKGAGYRKWHHGTFELVSPADQGKQANEWTDWVLTEARFIEYWMSEELILHLKKVE